MDLLTQELGGGGGGSRANDAELAKAMFEGTQQYRRKLKLPEMNEAAEKIKEQVRSATRAIAWLGKRALFTRGALVPRQAEDETFFAFYDEDLIGRFFFLKYVSVRRAATPFSNAAAPLKAARRRG